MDVFVTFFTGELDTETGVLIPKPFFTRWVFPGIALQLVLNPQMMVIRQYVWKMFIFIQTVGPIRMYRWSAAFFYPILSYSFRISLGSLWKIIVQHCNKYPMIQK
jgi:hypothetical protein